jgi:hypothetical protein
MGQPTILRTHDPVSGKTKSKKDWTQADAILLHTHTFLASIQADFNTRGSYL